MKIYTICILLVLFAKYMEHKDRLRLKGKSLYLAEFQETHLHNPRYFAWLRDLDVVGPIYRFEYLKPISFSVIENQVRMIMSSPNDCFFAIHLNQTNEFIGTLKIGHISLRAGLADIGILIGEKSHWGKGYAKDAIAVACHYAFETLSLRRLTAGTPSNNISMVKCFEKVGFQREGLLRKELLIKGEYVDKILFGTFKEELKM